MKLVGHVLDHMLDHMLDHILDYIIIGLVTIALQKYASILLFCDSVQLLV